MDLNEEVARLIIDLSAGSSSVVVLRAPLEQPQRVPWTLECRTTSYACGDREWTKSVGAGCASHLLRQLAAARVSAMPGCSMGVDGVTYELTLRQGVNSIVYRWWNEVPKGYEALAVFCNALLELGGINAVVSIGVN